MVLIDTSAWIFALRKNPRPAIKARIDELLADDVVAVNGLITLELLGGVRTQEEYDRLDARLGALTYVRSSRSLWKSAAELSFRLRRSGVTVPPADVFVAASALAVEARVLHADAHFDLIAAHSELEVESLLPLA